MPDLDALIDGFVDGVTRTADLVTEALIDGTDTIVKAMAPSAHRPPALRVVPGTNSFCGPAALSILTGCSTTEAARVLRETTGRRRIFGVWSSEMRNALADLRGAYGPLWQDQHPSPTLSQWAASTPPGLYLVNITNHYCVVRLSRMRWPVVCDNKTMTEVPLDQYECRRRRVQRVLKVS